MEVDVILNGGLTSLARVESEASVHTSHGVEDAVVHTKLNERRERLNEQGLSDDKADRVVPVHAKVRLSPVKDPVDNAIFAKDVLEVCILDREKNTCVHECCEENDHSDSLGLH